jgi:hypothetical protein
MPEYTLKRETRGVLWPILLSFVMFILATVFPAWCEAINPLLNERSFLEQTAVLYCMI